MIHQRDGIPTHALVSAVRDEETGRIGLAIILRDRYRNTVYSTAYTKDGLHFDAAAYHALSEALLSAHDHGAHTLVVYCDAASIVSQLEKREDVPVEALAAHLQSRALLHMFRSTEVILAHSGKHFTARKIAEQEALRAPQPKPLQPSLELPLTAT